MVQQATVEAINQEFTDAVRRRDAAAAAALYTEDAIMLPPNSEMIRGRPSINAALQAMLDAGVRELTLETVDVKYLGDVAYEVGNYGLKAEPGGGQSISDRGKYVVVWKRQGGGPWQLAVDIWNTSMPAPAA